MRHLTFVLLALAAGCGSSNNNGMNDLSTQFDLTIPPPTGDMAMVPSVNNGTLIAPGKLSILGITSDDFVVTADANSATQAVAVAGGANAVNTIETSDAVQIAGNAVFSWSNVDMNTGIGTLSVWTKASGLVQLSTSSAADIAAISADNAYVMFVDNASADGATGDIAIAHSDGTVKMAIFTNVSATTGACSPTLGALGTLLVASYCPPLGDAATQPAAIATVDPASHATNTLQTNVSGFWVGAGTELFYTDNNGAGFAQALAGGTSSAIDTNINLSTNVFMSSNGGKALYTTPNGTLNVGTTANPSVNTLLVAANVTDFESRNAVSGDFGYAIFYTNLDSGNQFSTDLFLANTSAASQTAVTLESDTLGSCGGDSGDCFTADSSHALFLGAIDADLTGTLNAQPVGGATPAAISTKVWAAWKATGTKIAYNDRYISDAASMKAFADVNTVDVAAPGNKTLIATQADLEIKVNTDGTKVVYVISNIAGSEGLYVAPIQ